MGKPTILNSIGKILENKGELDQALKCYKDALAIDEQLRDTYGKSLSLTNIGGVLCHKGKLDEALNYLREAMAIVEQLGDLRGKSLSLNKREGLPNTVLP